MSKKRITEVNYTESLNTNDSIFINQNSAIKQIGLENFVIDNLESTASNLAGSANQVRVLNEKIEKVEEDVKVIIDEELEEINGKIGKIEEAFQDGCNTIVAGCTTYGVQPESNSPEDIVEAIGEIYNLARVSTNTYKKIAEVNFVNINNDDDSVDGKTITCNVPKGKYIFNGIYTGHHNAKETPEDFVIVGGTQKNICNSTGNDDVMVSRVKTVEIIMDSAGKISCTYNTGAYEHHYEFLYMTISSVT